MEKYSPGLHIIATLQSEETALLDKFEDFKNLADQLIENYGLQKLGEVYHDFQPGGFTGVICLSESHISLHTWPEFNKINIDIYLSNYMRDNSATAKAIFHAISAHFKAAILVEQNIRR